MKDYSFAIAFFSEIINALNVYHSSYPSIDLAALSEAWLCSPLAEQIEAGG
jgi:hypothetical protein